MIVSLQVRSDVNFFEELQIIVNSPISLYISVDASWQSNVCDLSCPPTRSTASGVLCSSHDLTPHLHILTPPPSLSGVISISFNPRASLLSHTATSAGPAGSRPSWPNCRDDLWWSHCATTRPSLGHRGRNSASNSRQPRRERGAAMQLRRAFQVTLLGSMCELHFEKR